MKTHRHHQDECPSCFNPLNAATPMPGHDESVRPRPLDFALCVHCGSFLRYGEDLQIQVATEDEIDEELDPGQKEMMRKAQDFVKKRNGTNRI